MISPHRERPVVALIAHAIHDGGGMERAWAELIRHCHQSVDFVVVAADLDISLRPLVADWIRIRVPAKPFFLRFAFFFVKGRRAHRRLDVDLRHALGAIVPGRLDLCTVQFCQAAYVAYTGSRMPPDLSFWRRVNAGLARTIALYAERYCYRGTRLGRFLAVSEGVARELSLHYPELPCSVTPNGVDSALYTPSAQYGREVRAALKTQDSTFVALFVGGDWGRKGLRIAIEGIAAARRNHVDCELWVVGEGDVARFHRYAEELGVASSTTFLGARRDVARFYQAADALVSPTEYEAFSLVHLEAAAAGLPIIVTKVNGADELRAACLTVERDAGSVAAAIERVATNPGLRAALTAGALAAGSSFTWERSAESVRREYEAALIRQHGER